MISLSNNHDISVFEITDTDPSTATIDAGANGNGFNLDQWRCPSGKIQPDSTQELGITAYGQQSYSILRTTGINHLVKLQAEGSGLS